MLALLLFLPCANANADSMQNAAIIKIFFKIIISITIICSSKDQHNAVS